MSKRSEKMAETIHETISLLLSRGLNDPRIGFVTITAVEMTDDLGLARVFFTVVGDENARKNSIAGLNSAKGYIRRELGRSLSARYIPELIFSYDKSQDYGGRIDTILKEIASERAENNPEHSS